jgi:hypothetical protein
MIFGKKPDPYSGGNYPPELDALRATLRANLPKSEWPAIDRIFYALIQITKGPRMTTDMEMYRVQILTMVETAKSQNKEARSMLEDFEESLVSKLRNDLRSDFRKETVHCFRRADVAQIRIRWWPLLLCGLITGALGWFIGRETQPKRDFYFVMRQIGDSTLTFKAGPAPYNTSMSPRKPRPSEPEIIDIPGEAAADDGLESLQEDISRRLKNLQQSPR